MNTKDSPRISAPSSADFFSPLCPAGLHCDLQRLEAAGVCFPGEAVPVFFGSTAANILCNSACLSPSTVTTGFFLSLPATNNGDPQGSFFHFLLS